MYSAPHPPLLVSGSLSSSFSLSTCLCSALLGLWYCGLNTTVLLTAGLLSGVAQSVGGRIVVCAGCGAATAGQLAVTVTSRPFTTLFGDVYASMTLLLSFVSVSSQVGNLFLQHNGSTETDTLANLTPIRLFLLRFFCFCCVTTHKTFPSFSCKTPFFCFICDSKFVSFVRLFLSLSCMIE